MPQQQRVFLYKYHWGLVSSATLLLVSTLILIFLSPKFLANDDFLYKSFADGSFTGSPEIELVFVGKLQGLMLSALYNLSSEIAWYEFLMLATNSIAFIFLAQILKRSSSSRIGWFISVATIYTFLVLSPNNTATAIVSGGVAAAYLLRMALDTQARWFRFIPGTLLLFLSLSWREDAFYPVFLFATFLFASILFSRKLGRKMLLKSLLVLSIVGSTVLVIPALNGVCFETATVCEEWNSWNEYDAIRSTLHGSPRGEGLLLSNVVSGEISTWSIDEVTQFLYFSYFDEATHGYSKIKEIDSQLPESILGGSDVLWADPSSVINEFWPRFLSDFRVIFGLNGWWVLSIFVLVLPSLLRSSSSRARAILAVVTVSLGPIISLILASTIRLPIYVAVPILGLWAIGYLVLNSFTRLQKSDSSREGEENGSQFVFSFFLQIVFGVLALIFLRVAQAPVSGLLIVLVSTLIGYLLAYMHERKMDSHGLSEDFLAWVRRVGSFALVVLVFTVSFSSSAARLDSQRFPFPSTSVLSSSVQEKWRGQVFWAPGIVADFFLAKPYALGAVSLPRVTFGGWHTFSPHWHQRLEFIKAKPPTVKQFVSGDLLILIPSSYSEYSSYSEFFQSMNIFAGYELEWVGYFDESSLLEIWRVVE